MSKKYKNYFDDIKKTKAHDKFIEHIICLIFFAVVLSVEAIYKKGKETISHVNNIIKKRTMSDILKKYSRYKESVNVILHKNIKVQQLNDRIHEAMNRFFNDEEKKLIFGMKDSTHNLLGKSRQIISSVSVYTISMKNRFFKYKPLTSAGKFYSASMLTHFILNKYRNIINYSIGLNSKKNCIKTDSSGYKRFINETLTGFYSNKIKKKTFAAASDIKSFQPYIKNLLHAIEKLNSKQMKNYPGQL